MHSMPLPLPPLAEQQRIVAEVERRLSVVEELEATVAAGLRRAERLRQAILKRAFEGRLVAQDPSDEPATNYFGFCAWITARVLAHHSDATSARVRMEKVVLDGGEATSTGTFALVCERAR